MGKYWVKAGKGVQGPFNSAQIEKLAVAGKLKSHHQLSRDQEKWVAASSVKGLTLREDEGRKPSHPEPRATEANSAEYSIKASSDPERPLPAKGSRTGPTRLDSSEFWIVLIDGQEVGPIPANKVLDLFHAGSLKARDHLRMPNQPEWIKVESVSELQSKSDSKGTRGAATGQAANGLDPEASANSETNSVEKLKIAAIAVFLLAIVALIVWPIASYRAMGNWDSGEEWRTSIQAWNDRCDLCFRYMETKHDTGTNQDERVRFMSTVTGRVAQRSDKKWVTWRGNFQGIGGTGIDGVALEFEFETDPKWLEDVYDHPFTASPDHLSYWEELEPGTSVEFTGMVTHIKPRGYYRTATRSQIASVRNLSEYHGMRIIHVQPPKEDP